MEPLTVEQLFKETRKHLKLELLNNKASFKKLIDEQDLNRPGLALSGFVDVFTFKRVQIVGNTEIQFLKTMTRRERISALKKVMNFDIPCIIITEGNEPPDSFLDCASESAISVLRTPMSTTRMMHLLSDYMDDKFAPSVTLHGSLVDVYGVGVLFTGRSGIGKSEIALDLVERGHRLVADDIVHVARMAEGVLIGSPSELLEHHMEIRGLGIVDVQSVFGIRSIRHRKRVEVAVQLEEWDEAQSYERIGLDDSFTAILDVQVPTVRLPIFPGKNITVIAETLALTQILKVHGYHPAKRFNERLIERMKKKGDSSQTIDYMGRDYE
jgi:HPr kinase/phosphorylase